MTRHSKAIMLAAVLIGTIGPAAVVHAVPMVSVSAQGAAAAQAAEGAFLASWSGAYTSTETFEGFAPGAASQTSSLSTGVGTFSLDVAGHGGACDNGAYTCSGGSAVLDASSSPFSGRFAAPSGAGNHNWLDSMDAQVLTFTPIAGVTSLGFYLSDANDAGGRLGLGLSGMLFDNILGGAKGNGSLFYVSLFDSAGIGSFTLYTNNANDGYGIDNLTIAKVPEPGTWVLFGIGLLALYVTRLHRG